MKRWLIVLNVTVLVFLAATSYADHQIDGPPVAVGRGMQLKTLNQLITDLDAIEERNEDNRDKAARRFVRERITLMRRDLVMLRDDVEKAPIVRGQQPPMPMPNYPPQPPQGPVAMSGQEFAQVLGAYRNAYYTSQKYIVLQEVANQNWFDVDQVIVLVTETHWNTDKVKAAALLYPRVVDKKNWFKVYAALHWDSDREELRRLTTGMGPKQGLPGQGQPGFPR